MNSTVYQLGRTADRPPLNPPLVVMVDLSGLVCQ